jgi:hypothetical protein
LAQKVGGSRPRWTRLYSPTGNPTQVRNSPYTFPCAGPTACSRLVGPKAQIRPAAHSSDYYTLTKNTHTRCSTICMAALRPRGAFLRRRAPRPPAASLHHAGVREDGSPLRSSSGRQALPKTGPRGGGGGDDATRSARRRDTATPRLRRPFGGAASLGPSAGVRSTLGFRPPKPAGKNTTARRPTSKRSRCCARRDVEGRRVGRFHDEVVAAARWGAAGLDTRDQP